MVALGTGMRRSEIFWLPWDQVDLEAGTVSVKIQTRFMIKEKKEKVVPIPEFLRVYLTEERRAFPDERWLLDDGTGELAFKHPGALTRAFSRHFSALGINTDAKVIHGFRAKYISSLWESGVDLQTVQELAGHSSPLVTALYLTDPGSKKREAVKSLEGRLGVGFPT
jgi:integrase